MGAILFKTASWVNKMKILKQIYMNKKTPFVDKRQNWHDIAFFKQAKLGFLTLDLWYMHLM
jgi:hypothetical protein